MAIVSAAGGRPVVFAAGETGRAAKKLADRPNHFYLDGTSGLASSIGIGIALQARETTVVVDDANSVLANLAAMVTAGMLVDLPLVHIVLDDSLPAAGETPASRTDLTSLAMAVGYPRMYTVDVTDNLADLVRREAENCPSPVFVRCLLGDRATSARGRSGIRWPLRGNDSGWFADAA